MTMTEGEYLEGRIAEAKAAMIWAHDYLVEWYVQDQAEVIGVMGAIKAAHKTTPVQLIDAWFGKCPEHPVRRLPKESCPNA